MTQIERIHEAQVLGAAMAESGLWLAHAGRLTPEMFEHHQVLARELLSMTEQGHPTDPRSVQAWLSARGAQMRLADLLWIENQAPVSPNAMTVAVQFLHERVKASELRTLSRVVTQSLNESVTPDEIIERAFWSLTAIAARSSGDVLQIGKVLHGVVKNLGRPRQDGVKSGIEPLDQVTGGFKPGELVVLGGRPSMGKTALALGFATRAAMAGKSVIVFSLEMSTEQLCQRMLADLSRVNLARIVTRRVSDADISAITSAANTAHKWRLFIGESTNNIDPVCRQLKHKHGLDFVVVDYLQLMACKAESREQQIATLSRRLKQLALRLGVPVLVLSQLNRSVEARTCKRPQLSDLRESGAIEQDADLAMLLWRPGYYDVTLDQTEAELIIAKNRNGPTGDVLLDWIGYCARFEARKTQ